MYTLPKIQKNKFSLHVFDRLSDNYNFVFNNDVSYWTFNVFTRYERLQIIELFRVGLYTVHTSSVGAAPSSDYAFAARWKHGTVHTDRFNPMIILNARLELKQRYVIPRPLLYVAFVNHHLFHAMASLRRLASVYPICSHDHRKFMCVPSLSFGWRIVTEKPVWAVT